MKGRAIRALLIALALSGIVFLVPNPTVRTATGYTPHAPIYINGNADFTSANGVTSGAGTASNPFIIEGWEIDADPAWGIEILNTIQDVYLSREVTVA